MDRRQPPLLDMTPDGRFRQAAQGPGLGVQLSLRVLVGAVLVALVAGGLALAALAISALAVLVPVALVAVAVAWATVQWRRWRAGLRRGGSRALYR